MAGVYRRHRVVDRPTYFSSRSPNWSPVATAIGSSNYSSKSRPTRSSTSTAGCRRSASDLVPRTTAPGSRPTRSSRCRVRDRSGTSSERASELGSTTSRPTIGSDPLEGVPFAVLRPGRRCRHRARGRRRAAAFAERDCDALAAWGRIATSVLERLDADATDTTARERLRRNETDCDRARPTRSRTRRAAAERDRYRTLFRERSGTGCQVRDRRRRASRRASTTPSPTCSAPTLKRSSATPSTSRPSRRVSSGDGRRPRVAAGGRAAPARQPARDRRRRPRVPVYALVPSL